jgi:folate-binding protein YgfZ
LLRLGLSATGGTEALTAAMGALATNGYTLVRLPGERSRYLILAEPTAATALWQTLRATVKPVGAAAWTLLDVLAGIPSLAPAASDAFLPQMLNLEALGGLSFNKGCYPGQEIIARLQYRGELKRRLYLGRAPESELPQAGEALYQAGGASETPRVGELISAAKHPDGGIAFLAVVDVGAAAAGDLRLCSQEGLSVQLQLAPYPLPDPPPGRGREGAGVETPGC